jgi:hypothetical protein
MKIEYIILTYMQTAGRWCVTIHYDTGDEFTSHIHDGSWEDFVNSRFPGIEVKILDWRTKTWRDGIERA